MPGGNKHIRICWFGIYNPDYSRNYVFLDGLKSEAVSVIECRVEKGERFRYIKLLWRYWKIRKKVDVIYVAFPAQSMVLLIRFLTRKKIIMDAFYSMYDAIVNDRKMLSRWHPYVWVMFMADWLSVRLASKVVVDTQEHGKYWQTWGVPADKICVISVGSSTEKYYPMEVKKEDEKFIVHFHGTYIPLQGVELIIEAASLLADQADIQFRLIGSGQTYDQAITLSERKGLMNVTFIDRVSSTELNYYLNASDVVLGIFGDTDKAQRVVPNKLFEGLAVEKPVITLDTPAIREIVTEIDVKLIHREAKALADAILWLRDNPQERARQAERGYKVFIENFSQEKIAERLIALCRQLPFSIS